VWFILSHWHKGVAASYRQIFTYKHFCPAFLCQHLPVWTFSSLIFHLPCQPSASFSKILYLILNQVNTMKPNKRAHFHHDYNIRWSYQLSLLFNTQTITQSLWSRLFSYKNDSLVDIIITNAASFSQSESLLNDVTMFTSKYSFWNILIVSIFKVDKELNYVLTKVYVKRFIKWP